MGIWEGVRAQHNSITPKKTQIITNNKSVLSACLRASQGSDRQQERGKKKKGNTGQQSQSDVFTETKIGQILCLPHTIHINMPSL